ncbi:MAG TPA: citrate synthase [Polyangiaceae bacterium]|nr:citrate synthase [Polyangiaceae bacterium]
MPSSKATLAIGLEGIAVAETVLSHVDGAAGRLVVSGTDVEHLASTVPFEAVAARLWTAQDVGGAVRSLPPVEPADGPVDPDAVRSELGAARRAAHALLRTLGEALDAPDAMEALRASVAHLSEPQGRPGSPAWARNARIAGAVAVFATAWARRRGGLPAVAPDPSLGHAADYLRMLRGGPAGPEEANALDAYFVTVVDHGLSASTFAARVVTSTGSDVVSAVTAAIGALKGPLHGGAPGPVLDMLDAIGVPDRARAWLSSELAAGRRIMGMGHRVYRVRDPRAAVLEVALRRLTEAVGLRGSSDAERTSGRLALARAVEREATALLGERHADRALRANVEFYTAVLLEALGIPRELFSATFTAARVVGWTAHVDEERRKGRLIRPTSVYVGPMPTP